MRKLILCLFGYLVLTFAFSSKIASADETGSLNGEARLEHHISGLYDQIDFSSGERLPYEVFNKAYRGYLNLRNAGKLNEDRQVLTVCDLALPSSFSRMWVIDLDQKKVLFNTYVAHGQGSGEDCSLSFSNRNSTHKSSLGFYVTKDTYLGEHGLSLHLDGLDDGFNDAALDRGIVVHGADYVSEDYINARDRCGRSWGCPAVPSKLSQPIIDVIKEGTCLFIYYPEPKYLKASCWLNKKVTWFPDNSMYENTMPASSPKGREVRYLTNGHLDSVKR